MPWSILVLLGAWIFSSAANAQFPARSTPQTVSYAHLPLAFEANCGQSESQAAFLTQASGYSVRLGANKTELVKDGATLRFRYLNATSSPAVSGREELPGKANYYIGNDPTRWRTNIPTFAKVEYRNLYPGINLYYYGRQNGLEYDLVVAPGADPRQIRMAVEGASRLELDAQGDLLLQAGADTIRWHAPQIYQMRRGRRANVRGSFTLHGNVVGFRLGPYDSTRPLVIDPVLAFSTYLGPSALQSAFAVAVDSAGNSYLTGSASLPSGAFVLKLNAAGTAVLYTARFGGNGISIGYAIAVDASGNAYVTGRTVSPDFPLTNPVQTTYGGATGDLVGDAFVTVLSADGSRMLFSTYLGGSGDDVGAAIAVDNSGNAYVTGSTSSSNFPTARPYQSSFAGGAGRYQQGDAFVAKLNTGAATLAYSTYLGGSNDDAGYGIAVDTTGNAYVTGATFSTNFPTARPLQAASGGSRDAFLAKLDPTGATLLYSTYLGGTKDDAGAAVAVDAPGNAYVTGATGSTNFPTVNPLRGTLASIQDAFVIKVNAAGSALVFSTFLGGVTSGPPSSPNSSAGIVLDAVGNIYLSGTTTSSSFPLVNPLQPFFGGGLCSDGPVSQIFYPCYDVFVTKLNPAATTILYSTFLGGSGSDVAAGIALDSAGNVYVAGSTRSADFPTLNAVQAVFPNLNSTLSGSPFVAKLTDTGVSCAYSVSPASQSFSGNQATGTVTLSTATGCVWTAVSNDSWLTITSPSHGTASATITFAIASNTSLASRRGTLSIDGQLVTITQGDINVSGPVINAGGVVNAANYSAKGVAGMIGSVFGINLASVTMSASSTPLPTSLGGVSVTASTASSSVAVPLFYVSPTQINFQLPWDVPVSALMIDNVIVTNGGLSFGASLPMLRFAPAIFSLDSSGSGPGAILISNTANLAQPAGSVAGRTSSPAPRGGYISIYCTGLGPLKETPPANGAVAPAGTLFNVVEATTVSIGGIQVTPSFAGLAPGFVGLYQVDALVPASVTPGNTVPVVLTVGGVSSSNTVTIAVQ